MQELIIVTEFIELQNALKLLNYISTGGESKWFIQENDCLINGTKETRRGRKLFDGDILEIQNKKYLIKHETS
ncbi:RNA-binding S4 domain-containing protein [bacterium]|nr:RNA-binding S4 domain-containing protein [bacterium]